MTNRKIKPPKQEVRKHRVEVRLNDTELALLNEIIEKTGLTASDIVRQPLVQYAQGVKLSA